MLQMQIVSQFGWVSEGRISIFSYVHSDNESDLSTCHLCNCAAYVRMNTFFHPFLK